MTVIMKKLGYLRNWIRYYMNKITTFSCSSIVLCKHYISLYILRKKRINVKFAICAILKNEGDYVEEWLNYHHLIGVQKFYLYDNDSDDDTAEILRKYADKGWVEYNPIHGRGQHLTAYRRCLSNHKWDTEYIAFIDGDEFLNPLQSDNIYDAVNDVIKVNKHAAGIAVPWRMFGSSGHITKPETDVLHSYLYYCNIDEPIGVKRIVKPDLVLRVCNSHVMSFIGPFYAIDEYGKRVDGWNYKVGELHKIQLNHYFTKSKEEWIKRRAIGMSDHKDNQTRGMEEFYAYDHNDIYDDSIVRLVESLKK